MFKHRLMLSAAATALLTGTAFADTTISTATTTALKTSTVNSGAADNIIISSAGSVTIDATGAAVTIDTSNTLDNEGTISNKNADSGRGIIIDATSAPAAGLTGSLITNGTIDLTGTGSSKAGISVTGGNFVGDITLGSLSNINVTGDLSTGIGLTTGSTITGNLFAGGALTVNQTTVGSTVSSGLSLISLNGALTKDLIMSGTYTAIGAGSQGIVVGTGGSIGGTLEITGALETAGVATISTKVLNPEGGSAISIAGSVAHGLYIAGPTGAADTTVAGTVTMIGTGPVINIAASTADITLGAVPVAIDGGASGFDFINRGTIVGNTTDANQTAPVIGVQFGGSSSFKTTLADGFLNTGTISSSEVSATSGLNNPASGGAVGLIIGGNTVMPKLVNQFLSATAAGQITASVSGISGGTATAIGIATDANPGTTMEIDNLDNAAILASVSTTDTTVATASATAINDQSGTLTKIVNTGSIQALATPLDDDLQTAVAIDSHLNTLGLEIDNGSVSHVGTIVGDIKLGSGADTINVIGASGSPSTIAGDISFGVSTGAADTLNLQSFGIVKGAVTSDDGNFNVIIGGNSKLELDNTNLATPEAMLVNTLDVKSLGELDVTVAQTLATGAVKVNGAAGNINLESGALFNVNFGSFITNTNTFVLLDAPNGQLTLPDAADYAADFTTPFLFTGGICTHNVDAAHGGATTGCTDPSITSTHSQLILSLTQKTAAQLNLTGYAATPVADVDPDTAVTTPGTLYDLVSHVLPIDNALGGAIVTGVTDAATAQKVFDAFAPQVTGGSRAILVSLTDQATGAVGARQRLLRTYGKQSGESTLWGVEYAQFMKDPGDTIAATSTTPAGLLPGYKDHGFGFTLGADGGSANSGWYGGALTFYTGDIGELGDRNGQTQTEWYMLSGYTDWRGRGLFLDTNLGAGVAQFKTRRTLDIDLGTSDFIRNANSKHIGVYLTGGLTTGVILQYGGTAITPQLSIDGATMRENGYNETGGGGVAGDAFDLDVGASYTNSLRSFLGLDLRQDLDLGSFLLQPEMRAGYRYDFLHDAQKVTSSFVGMPGLDFTVAGPDPAQGNLVLGGTLAASTDTWSLGVTYDFVHGTNGANQQSGMLTLLGRI